MFGYNYMMDRSTTIHRQQMGRQVSRGKWRLDVTKWSLYRSEYTSETNGPRWCDRAKWYDIHRSHLFIIYHLQQLSTIKILQVTVTIGERLLLAANRMILDSNNSLSSGIPWQQQNLSLSLRMYIIAWSLVDGSWPTKYYIYIIYRAHYIIRKLHVTR